MNHRGFYLLDSAEQEESKFTNKKLNLKRFSYSKSGFRLKIW